MGSGRNKGFDPKNPDSKPYEEKKTGMGRFLQRFGSGVDPGELNNEYVAKRYADERNFDQQKELQTQAHEQRSQLADKEEKSRWSLLKSRLDNDAVLETTRQGFQSRLLGERNAEDRRKDHMREAQRLYELTGETDPIMQQEVLSKIRTQKMNEPMPLGSGSFYDRRTGNVHSRVPASGLGFDPATGEMTPAQPESWRSWNPLSPDTNSSAPSSGTAPQPGAGRSLGNPEEIRAALGIKPKVPGGGAGPMPQSGVAEGTAQPMSSNDQAVTGLRGFSPQTASRIWDIVRNALTSTPTPLNRDGMESSRAQFEGLVGKSIPELAGKNPDIVSQLLEKRRSAEAQNQIKAVRGY